jgi:hypothetical protein
MPDHPLDPTERAAMRAEIAEAIRAAKLSGRRDWRQVELLIREFVRPLKAAGVKPERVVGEVKAMITAATGDPSHSITPSAITWALEEYYDRRSTPPSVDDRFSP